MGSLLAAIGMNVAQPFRGVPASVDRSGERGAAYRERLAMARSLLVGAPKHPKLNDPDAMQIWYVLDDALAIALSILGMARVDPKSDSYLVDEAVAFAREYVELNPSSRLEILAEAARFTDVGLSLPISLARLVGDLASAPIKHQKSFTREERDRWTNVSRSVHGLVLEGMSKEDAAVLMEVNFRANQEDSAGPSRNRKGIGSETILKHYAIWLKHYENLPPIARE